MFKLFQLPEVNDEQSIKDAEMVEVDLQTLKAVMESMTLNMTRLEVESGKIWQVNDAGILR